MKLRNFLKREVGALPAAAAIFGLVGAVSYFTKEATEILGERVVPSLYAQGQTKNRVYTVIVQQSELTRGLQAGAGVSNIQDTADYDRHLQAKMIEILWSHIQRGRLDLQRLITKIPALSHTEQLSLLQLLTENKLLTRALFKKEVFDKLSPKEILDTTISRSYQNVSDIGEIYQALVGEGIITKRELLENLLARGVDGQLALTKITFFFDDPSIGLRSILQGKNMSIKEDLALHYRILVRFISPEAFQSLESELREQGLIPPDRGRETGVQVGVQDFVIPAEATKIATLVSEGRYMEILQRSQEFGLTQSERDYYGQLILSSPYESIEWFSFFVLVSERTLSPTLYPSIKQILGAKGYLFYAEYSPPFIDWYGRRAFIQYMIQDNRIENLTEKPESLELTLQEVDQLLSILQKEGILRNIQTLLRYRATLV